MFGNRGIYHDGWYANTTPAYPPWDSTSQPPADVVNGYARELYNLAEDPTQSRNLAAQHPDRLRDLQQLYLVEATRFGVLPMDNSTLSRLLPHHPAGRGAELKRPCHGTALHGDMQGRDRFRCCAQ